MASGDKGTAAQAISVASTQGGRAAQVSSAVVKRANNIQKSLVSACEWLPCLICRLMLGIVYEGWEMA